MADRLGEAADASRPIIDHGSWPILGLDQAYAAQGLLVDRRLARGERSTGLKLGFTSLAKMQQMGVDEIVAGHLTDAMALSDGGTLDIAHLIRPRVEPEICFRVGHDVDLTQGPQALLLAVSQVAPALEVIDSRFKDFSFDLPRVIADNTSAAAYVVGPWSHLDRDAVGHLPVRMELNSGVDDVERIEGNTSAILGDPLDALVRLADLGAEHGFTVRAGDVILAGAATAAVQLVPGVVRASVARLGSVALKVVDSGRS